MPPALDDLEDSPHRSPTISPAANMPPPPRPKTTDNRRRARVDSTDDEEEAERPPVSAVPPRKKRSRLLSGLHPSQDIIGGMSQDWDAPGTTPAAPSRRKTRARGVVPQKQPGYDAKYHPMDLVIRPKQVAKKYKDLVEPVIINTDVEGDDDEDDEDARLRARRNQRRGSSSSYEGPAVETKAKARPRKMRKSKRKPASKPTKTDDLGNLDDLTDLENDDQDDVEDKDGRPHASNSKEIIAKIVKHLDVIFKEVEEMKPLRDGLKARMDKKRKKKKSAMVIPIHEDGDQLQANILQSRPNFPLPRLEEDFEKENEGANIFRRNENETGDEHTERGAQNVNPQNDQYMEDADEGEVSQYILEVANDGMDTEERLPIAQTGFATINNSARYGETMNQFGPMEHSAHPPSIAPQRLSRPFVPETQSQPFSIRTRTPPQTSGEDSSTPQSHERTIRDTHLTESQSAEMDEESQFQRHRHEEEEYGEDEEEEWEDEDEDEWEDEDENEDDFGSDMPMLSELLRHNRRDRSSSL